MDALSARPETADLLAVTLWAPIGPGLAALLPSAQPCCSKHWFDRQLIDGIM